MVFLFYSIQALQQFDKSSWLVIIKIGFNIKNKKGKGVIEMNKEDKRWLKDEFSSIEKRMTSMEVNLDNRIDSLERKYKFLEITMDAMTRISALSSGNMESMPMVWTNRGGYKTKKRVRVPGF